MVARVRGVGGAFSLRRYIGVCPSGIAGIMRGCRRAAHNVRGAALGGIRHSAAVFFVRTWSTLWRSAGYRANASLVRCKSLNARDAYHVIPRRSPPASGA